MGRIKKAAGPKHEATVSPAVAEFVKVGCSIPICQLPRHLESFPKGWPFPRGDLYHWIPLLDRFDAILQAFVVEYGLETGPQTKPFLRTVLETGVAEENKAANVTGSSQKELDQLGYQNDGDERLIEAILHHSQLLLENCGNRSLYNSSERLGALLNTTSLCLLSTTLHVTSRLAQRYHASRLRSGTANTHMSMAMLASHYNIELDKVQQLANPFNRLASPVESALDIGNSISTSKEKSQNSRRHSAATDPGDLLSLVQDNAASKGSDHRSEALEQPDLRFQDLVGIHMAYYQPASSNDEKKNLSTATPTKKASGSFASRRLSSSEESTDKINTPSTPKGSEVDSGAMKTLDIPATKIRSQPIQDVLEEGLKILPTALAYNFLTRVRIASAVAGPLESRQEIVKIRLLGITNLAFIYPESILQQKILQQDSDEPRRFQIIQQLTSILHPPGNGEAKIPVKLQTVALGTLEALAKHKSKEADICAALSINVNHGVFFYVLRKAVAEMSIDEDSGPDFDAVERREATLSLLEVLTKSNPRVTETLVGAGLFDILVEALNLRSKTVERHRPKLIIALTNVLQAPRENLQIFANAKGLDALSGLVGFEVRSALDNAEKGRGLPQDYRNQTTDYQIPYLQRETLRLLSRCTSNLLGNNGGNVDRLLRNLIDSPPLLGGLRTVILNPSIFGAAVWSGSVNILSSFIHGEPTSYSIIAESGLSRGFIQSVIGSQIDDNPATDEKESTRSGDVNDEASTESTNAEKSEFQKSLIREMEKSDGPLAKGILPHVDAILAIPQAFGAICLNNSGKKLLLDSSALFRFFEVFESTEHIKAMTATIEYDTPRLLGNAFDELVRHHPDLKSPVLASILVMIRRVAVACHERGGNSRCGAKLWTHAENGALQRSGDRLPNADASGDNEDVIMTDVDDASNANSDSQDQEKSSAVMTAPSAEDEKESITIANCIEVAMRFFGGLFENNQLLALFLDNHGASTILDLATMPYLPYDFNNHPASQEISKVVHMLAESKPHLVVPELLLRTLDATEILRPLYECETEEGFFADFTVPGESPSINLKSSGTKIAQSLVVVQTLCNILYEVFSPPILNPRSTHTPFSQINLADYYVKIVDNLGLLHRTCVWEEILLQKRLPESWKEATRIKGYGMGSEEADEVFGFINNEEVSTEPAGVSSTGPNAGSTGSESGSGKAIRKASISKDESTAQFRNARALRYLLSQIPSCIVPFFQGLGKSLVAKRRPETYLKQNAYLVAGAMSRANINQLDFSVSKQASSPQDRYAYWIVILTSISQLMIESGMDRPHPQVLTLLLQTFREDGGMDLIQKILNVFYQEVQSLQGLDEISTDADSRAARLTSAYGGIKIILSFYSQISAPKAITDSTQSHSIASTDRDRSSAHFFSAQQFLVEIRRSVLSDVSLLWGSDFVDKASTSIVKCLIDILTTVLEGSDEQEAFRRGEEIPVRKKAHHKIFNTASDKVRQLVDRGFDKDLAQEALYRCMNTSPSATEYCTYWKADNAPKRLPIPGYDREKPHKSTSRSPARAVTNAASTPNLGNLTTPGGPAQEPRDQATTDAADSLFLLAQGNHHNRVGDTLIEVEEADGEPLAAGGMPPPPAPGVPHDAEFEAGERMQMSLDSLDINPITGRHPQHASDDTPTPEQSSVNAPSPSGPAPDKQTTVDDLNDDRAKVRANLVERILDVLNVHEDVTFELASLISAAALRESADIGFREETGETLIEALISFTMEDDFRSSGKKIASYAHLLGICLQDVSFFEASSNCLKENIGSLMGFIKIFPDQGPEVPSVWIGSILLVLERLLAEDAQPPQLHWNLPNPDVPFDPKDNVLNMPEPLIPAAEKHQLTDALLDIMPRIGRDESLALSVVRVLVILTRHREIASKISEKRNIQRLFVMIKQLSGMTNQKLPSTFVILLRHIIEDEDTVKQIMKSEIINAFENRPGRHTDTMAYLRQMTHHVLRAPENFVEVTNEVMEIPRYEKEIKNQLLGLKPSITGTTTEDQGDTEEPQDAAKSNEAGDSAGQDAESSKESMQVEAQSEPTEASKGKSNETKAPTVEKPSGVIHYLLTELLAYKDVDDKDPQQPTKQNGVGEVKASAPASPAPSAAESSNSTPVPPDNVPAADQKKTDRPEFRLDQHPIHFYRCFILQCLTEILQSYNRAKIEFINFSRKADPKAMTPSKPRSGVLSYLLNDVIPVGTLIHEDSIAFKKKTYTSNWAISSIVALCLRTNETGYEAKSGSVSEDEQIELLFVRKFVLEHALKAYKDASASDEHPDVKYARLLDIADLFQRLLVGRLMIPVGAVSQNPDIGFQKSIAKIMYEKNFIGALTSSIADIDLNFPGSKRAIKYILRPLKQLTQTAILLSETSSISSALDQTDEDEISSATSVSDVGNEREETPDLFRNSTLGMLEPPRDEESASGSSDEDDEIYDDEDEDDEAMEYEDEMEHDGDGVISDEDEELGEAGPIEGLHGDAGMDVEVVIDDDDDDEDEDGDEDEESTDEEEDPDDSESDDELQHHVDDLDEITGDDENASLADGDEDGWAADMDEDEEGGEYEIQGPGEEVEAGIRSMLNDFDAAAETSIHLEGLEDGPANLQMDVGTGRYMEDVIRNEEEEEEDEQDQEDDDREEDMDEEEEIFPDDYDDDDQGIPDPPWGFDPDDEPFATDQRHHHHHHHHHHRHGRARLEEAWNVFPTGQPPTRTSMPLYRSHRSGSSMMRSSESGAHPLLQRGDGTPSGGMPPPTRHREVLNPGSLHDFWVHGMDGRAGPRGAMIDSPVSFVNSIIAALGHNSGIGPIGGGNGAIHVQIGGPGRGNVVSGRGIMPDLRTLLGPQSHTHDSVRLNRDEQAPPAVIVPMPTSQRWQEEARLIWNGNMNDKAMRVLDSVLRSLVPPAIERKRQQEELTKRLKEEQDRIREEERKAKEKAEEELQAREKEEREAVERALREAAAQAEAESEQISHHDEENSAAEQSEGGHAADEGAMEGVEMTENETTAAPEWESAQPQVAQAESSETQERIVTRLGDREIDITGLGIDLAYLDALPEDIRQEVLMSQIAIQRSQAAAAGEPPSEISQDFLAALPPEIREELLQSEAQDRRRREREEARRQQQAAGGGPSAEDMDPASFFASLDPVLRQHVLADQDEEMLAHLPPDIAAEARALGAERHMHRFAGIPGRRTPGLSRLLDARTDTRRPSTGKKAPKRQVVQMLDKSGVATLLRLIFVPQQGSTRESFHAILRHISENRQTRAEVVSLLLSILQDGSFDVNAVERSFTQLSLRAKQSSVQKTPQPLKRSLTGTIASARNSLEVAPLTVVQQCLSTLVSLITANPHVPYFFLTEHDLSLGVKSKANRKGKMKETKASKYPVNALLSLLDRKIIMESAVCLEQLANLLMNVTSPLNSILKSQSQETDKSENPTPTDAADVPQPTTENTTTNNEPSGNLPQANTTEDTTAVLSASVQEEPAAEGADLQAHKDTQIQESGQDEITRKPRSMSPPVIPEENLRLVVSIIAARECSKRTFQQTVATISNLKAIPGAKETFGKGLIEQAQDLGQSILWDLDELLLQVKRAGSGTDVQGLALPKFATASSHQSKLLRVLTALDYLFGSKESENKSQQPSDTKEGEEDAFAAEKDDMLTSLYENSTFGPLWDKLSECLSAIRQGEGMLNIASILQPLIEALMVVCKNTASKAEVSRKNAKEFAVTSPVPESRIESLFFRFTEEHRKILNELVRHSPKLMMGTFSLLVKNPKVLEFDNKRSYFNRRLHTRSAEARHPQPPLQLSVRRDQVFLDSFKGLSFKTGDEIKYGKLSIRFHGEEGVDAGGVTREWFQVLSRQMFNPDYALFIPVASDRTTFHPNKLSKVNEEHLFFFRFIGRIIGKALYEGRALDCHFSRAVYKRILGKTVSIKDMETLDLEYHKSLNWMLGHDITDVITETFSVETDDFGVTEIVDLVENGRNIPVTEENKQEYVQLMVEYRLTGSVQVQLEKFLEGFHDVVSPELISIFNEQELELLISGLPDIDVDDWKNHSEYHNYQASSPQIQWFWRAVRSFDKEERAKLLQFVTGTSKVPLNGFGQLEGMNGFSRFNIHKDYGNKERLPSSHTCFNQLDIPEYESYESLRSHLYTAMTAGSEYFGFA